MSAELTVAVSMACAVGGFCLSFAALRRGLRKDCADAGRHDGMVLAELGYIKSSVDDIKAEQKALSGKVSELAVKQAMLERDVKTAFAPPRDARGELRQ